MTDAIIRRASAHTRCVD